MELDERTVQEALSTLTYKHLVLDRPGFSRVPKYQHRFCNTGFGSLSFSPLETAILCELLLRGPQTPGELRTRAARMAQVSEASEVEAALHNLAQRQEGPFVVQLPREPSRRDSRYAHLLSGEVEVSALPTDDAVGHELFEPAPPSRMEQLEHQVAELRRELNELKASLRP
jgi:uncharacterized protein YceH (UPF0502 family)